MAYKLAAIDIDGTLLTDDYRITEKNKKALRAAEEEGVQIVLCSGRAPVSVLPILEEIGIHGYFICHNGAVTTHSKTKEILQENGFSMQSLRGVVEYCRRENIHMDFCTAFDMYTESMEREDVQRMYAKYLAQPKLIQDMLTVEDKLVKFTLFGTDEQLNKAYDEFAAMNLPVRTLRSGPSYIDIIDKATSKGAALSNLAEYLNISLADTIAIGNYYNDLDMITMAGIGVAVANAPEDVKEKADLIVASNNESGVAEALQRLVFGMKNCV
ncbi:MULTISPECIES: Cof-type HAD-IIB family hydrolase [Aneurinibacillus]|uniref:Cof-type HAD-IIB family hydrolase n=1 Tax=Aneurinibacillus thermoaerophilus TaxID=143495 RepID=A0A1G7YPQ8_ANETH|nr:MULTISPECIES: Cof-type HAD-IIB family hydrolase [Aneurinibacillus]MED0677134.1 Cof-type HAD-IIB family hydrolase [Aneurinibacillus thermoaerophilus]MED0679406.1 Cof-type HAD-IIB family hydrolase [Aneurinibacillus thermoaerophilus]MED0738023.1 Cof-type HAD-IIB family hydrolase [Aneurinibacillus thermoaerophilus]MED0756444.1 Cof-type HAD-IIB family hydrolase [Aneurinibacillus thermoaerophilus]MED0761157.1 Cof-type HAD-IIB family hydrolase [Aneurinibacillus thermoaerophilus]